MFHVEEEEPVIVCLLRLDTSVVAAVRPGLLVIDSEECRRRRLKGEIAVDSVDWVVIDGSALCGIDGVEVAEL